MANLSVVPIGPKKCKPFILEVFVASPEAGYKFELTVEKSCTSTNDPLFKLVFDLYKKDASGVFQQIVHGTPIFNDLKPVFFTLFFLSCS